MQRKFKCSDVSLPRLSRKLPRQSSPGAKASRLMGPNGPHAKIQRDSDSKKIFEVMDGVIEMRQTRNDPGAAYGNCEKGHDNSSVQRTNAGDRLGVLSCSYLRKSCDVGKR